MPKERLDKIFSSQTYMSRSDAVKMIKNGRVSVDGKIITSPDFKVDGEKCEIRIDGLKFVYRRHVYFMMNKPDGVISASDSPDDRTVVDLIDEKDSRPGLFPAGRLDKDTVGFVLITDDGDFAHKILSPKNHISKTYHALLREDVSSDDIEMMKKGMKLNDDELLPAFVKKISDSEKLYEIVICEGKYHQIKRMFLKLGNEVIQLKRVAMGRLLLDEKLDYGDYRPISDEELELIRMKNPVSDC